ncbi:MAG: TauD/TfdA family dioxygenase [Actinomycetia bacterium]|nr:TauD/TfdA family dioxygenase [Actinomycetes bacterium]
MPTKITEGELDVAAAWRGADLRRSTAWIDHWTPAEIADLDTLIAGNPGLGLADLAELGPDDLILPGLADRFADWRPQIFRSRGVVLVKGLPVERWSDDEAALAYWAIGQGLGLPIVQNPEGHVLGHVTDTGRQADDPNVRLYQTPDNIQYHVDGASVVGLLCLRTALEGGASRLVSSVTVHNEVWRRRPDLVPDLFGRFPIDRRNEERPGEDPYWMMPMARWDGDRLRTFYHADYMGSSQRHDSAPRFSPAQQELLALIDEIGADPDIHLEMNLEPGDIQLISNEVTLHARTAYVDRPGSKRHLLRLWLDERPEANRAACDDTRYGMRARH